MVCPAEMGDTGIGRLPVYCLDRMVLATPTNANGGGRGG